MLRFALAALLALAGLPAQAAPALTVLQRAPEGETESLDAMAEIRATFSAPMVELGAAKESGEFCPIRIEPKLPGRCRWRGTDTLAFEPDLKAIKPGTRYRVTIPKGTQSRVSGASLEKETSWEFVSMRLALVDSVPRHNEQWVAKDGKFILWFNLPVDADKAASHLELSSRTTAEEPALSGLMDMCERRGLLKEGQDAPCGFKVRLATRDEARAAFPHLFGAGDDSLPSRSRRALKARRFGQSPLQADRIPPECFLTVVPDKPLGLDQRVTLTLRNGFPAKDGSEGMTKDRELSILTWRSFRVVHLPPAEETDCHRDGGCVSLVFSNPVSRPSVLAALKGERGWKGDVALNAYTLHDLGEMVKPSSSFSFTLPKGLKDAKGETLQEDVAFSVKTAPLCPEFRMNEGFGVLEQALPLRHPAEGVNTRDVTLRCWVVEDDEAVGAMEGFWRNACDYPGGEDKTVRFNVRDDQRVRSFLDVGALRGGKAGSVVLLRGPNQGEYCPTATDNITPLGLTLKTSRDRTLLWVSELATGKPAPNVQVELRDSENRSLFKGISDPMGFCQAPGWKGLGLRQRNYQQPKVWALARSAKGTAFLSSEHALEPWRFGINADPGAQSRRLNGLLFSDRGVARPGETVRFKGVARELGAGDWVLAKFGPLKATIEDPRGRRVFSQELSPTAQGGFEFAYTPGSDAATGGYSVRVEESPQPQGEAIRPSDEAREEEEDGRGVARLNLYHAFRVEAVKRANFEVVVTPLKRHGFGGEAAFTALCRYLHGAAMRGGKARWVTVASPAEYAPDGWEGYRFSPLEEEEGWRRAHPETDQGQADLDPQGALSITAKVKNAGSAAHWRVMAEVSAEGPDRQRLAGRQSAMLHLADLCVGAKPDGQFGEEGKPWTASLVATDVEGKPVKGRPLKVKAMRRVWHSAQKTGVGGRLEWVSETKDEEAGEWELTSSDKPVPFSFTPKKPGMYRMAFMGKDAEGRPASSGLDFWCAGSGEAWWMEDNSDVVGLVPDRNRYQAGDTARVMVRSPWKECTAVVTLERETVLWRRVFTLKGSAPVLEVPLAEACLPNAFLGVMLVRGRVDGMGFGKEGAEDLGKPGCKFGYVDLKVDPKDRRLDVTLATDAKNYRPRGQVEATLTVRDAKGKPVEGEATVWCVDEGVLSLTGYETPDLFGAFYGSRPLAFLTADNRSFVIGQRDFGEKGKNRGGGGGEEAEGADLRSNFEPVAFWKGTVTLDKDGKAKLAFALPDSLTRYRLMAAVHAGPLMGGAQCAFTASKPLMLKPSQPRFARVGDRFKAGVVVHSNLGVDADIRVSLDLSKAPALACAQPLTRTVRVAPGRPVELLWDLAANALGDPTLSVKAEAAALKERDGLSTPLPIKPVERLETNATLGETLDQAIEKVKLPEGARLEIGGLTFTAASTALVGLKGGVAYLLDYPHGCLEQQMSRALPIIAGGELAKAFGMGGLDGLRSAARQTLKRLPEFQSGRGFYMYWTDCAWGDPWLTAYCLDIAALAKREGWEVPEDSLNRAAEALEVWMASDRFEGYPYSKNELNTCRAFSLQALAAWGRQPKGYLNNLYDVRDQTPIMGRASLLLAAKRLGADQTMRDTLAQSLLNQARMAPRSMHFEEPGKERMPWIHESTVATTALCLRALTENGGPGFPNDTKAVAWLMGERKDKGRWRTTQENASSLRALLDYLRAKEAEPPSFEAVLRANGLELWKAPFKGRSLDSRSAAFTLAQIFGSGGTSELAIAKTGAGRLYYSLALTWAPVSFAQPSWEGLEIERRLLDAKGRVADRFVAGERYQVELKVRSRQDRTFVALTDALPAGFEVVDSSLATEAHERANGGLGEGQNAAPWLGGFQRSEKYDDRVQVYADFLGNGERTYTYTVQATTPGEYLLPAAWVEQMYEPEVFGRTASGTVRVVAKP